MKSVSRLACPLSKTFSSPGKTQTNSPVMTKKTMAAISPEKDEKKLLSSFMKIAYMLNALLIHTKIAILWDCGDGKGKTFEKNMSQ